MSVLSRFALNMAANVGLQYAAELLPTPIRTQGVGLIHIFGIIAHSIAPYVVDSVSDLSYSSVRKYWGTLTQLFRIMRRSDIISIIRKLLLLRNYFRSDDSSKKFNYI